MSSHYHRTQYQRELAEVANGSRKSHLTSAHSAAQESAAESRELSEYSRRQADAAARTADAVVHARQDAKRAADLAQLDQEAFHADMRLFELERNEIARADAEEAEAHRALVTQALSERATADASARHIEHMRRSPAYFAASKVAELHTLHTVLAEKGEVEKILRDASSLYSKMCATYVNITRQDEEEVAKTRRDYDDLRVKNDALLFKRRTSLRETERALAALKSPLHPTSWFGATARMRKDGKAEIARLQDEIDDLELELEKAEAAARKAEPIKASINVRAVLDTYKASEKAAEIQQQLDAWFAQAPRTPDIQRLCEQKAKATIAAREIDASICCELDQLSKRGKSCFLPGIGVLPTGNALEDLLTEIADARKKASSAPAGHAALWLIKYALESEILRVNPEVQYSKNDWNFDSSTKPAPIDDDFNFDSGDSAVSQLDAGDSDLGGFDFDFDEAEMDASLEDANAQVPEESAHAAARKKPGSDDPDVTRGFFS